MIVHMSDVCSAHRTISSPYNCDDRQDYVQLSRTIVMYGTCMIVTMYNRARTIVTMYNCARTIVTMYNCARTIITMYDRARYDIYPSSQTPTSNHGCRDSDEDLKVCLCRKLLGSLATNLFIRDSLL